MGIDKEHLDWCLSVCTYATKHPHVLHIGDASTHPWLSTHPLLKIQPQISQFASFPLQPDAPHSAGVLCLFGLTVRQLTRQQIDQLSAIAIAVGQIYQSSKKQNLNPANRLQPKAIRVEERQRIAREFHDELGQHLVMLTLDLALMKKHSKGQMHTVMATALARVEQSIVSAREIIRHGRPAGLKLGLIAAIKQLIQQYEHATSMHVDFVSDGLTSTDQIAESISLILFRCTQEALNNIVRHAKASKVSIRLWYEQAEIHLQIVDNGAGVAIEPPLSTMPLTRGLAGMRERVTAANGKLTFQSSPGNGTALYVSLPYPSGSYRQDRPQTIGRLNTLHQ